MKSWDCRTSTKILSLESFGNSYSYISTITENHAVSLVLKEEFFKYEMILKCYDHVCRRENNDRVDLTRFKATIEATNQ